MHNWKRNLRHTCHHYMLPGSRDKIGNLNVSFIWASPKAFWTFASLPCSMVAFRVCSAHKEPNCGSRFSNNRQSLSVAWSRLCRKGRAFANSNWASPSLLFGMLAWGSSPKATSLGQISSSSCKAPPRFRKSQHSIRAKCKEDLQVDFVKQAMHIGTG